MTVQGAAAFVRRHGVVLVSAKGPAPNLVEAIAGEPIRGSWWGHPKGKLIFSILGEVTDSPDVLVCRLVGGKLTLVHRRLWPALARVAKRVAPGRAARVIQEHTPSGKHVNRAIPFPDWLPAEAARAAERLSEAEA